MENKTNERIDSSESAEKVQSQGSQSIAIGVGVGVGGLGTVVAMTLGATCPLCIVAAPALIGVGVYRRMCVKGYYRVSETP